MAPLLLTKCGGTLCGEAIWLVFVAQGPGERLLWNPSAGGIFTSSLPGAVNVYVSTLERLDRDICRWACQFQLRYCLGEGSAQAEDDKTDLPRRWSEG